MKKIKKVYARNLSTNEIIEFSSLTEAANRLGSSTSNISKGCRGIFHSVKGYKLGYSESDVQGEPIKNKTTAIAVFSVNPISFEIKKYSSMADASRETGCKVSDCCLGKKKISKGLHWFIDNEENRKNYMDIVESYKNEKKKKRKSINVINKISIDPNVRFIVYEHVNKVNKKRYIGITSQQPERRWKSGSGYKTNEHFYKAIQKYGWDNFEHNILFEDLTYSEASAKEIELIKKYDTMNPEKGYNNNSGGSAAIPSEITRKKLSDSHKGQKNNGSELRKGKHLSEAHREKLRKIWAEKTARGESNFPKKSGIKCVLGIAEDGEKLLFNNAKEAGEYFGYRSSAHIKESIRGSRRCVAGYIWMEFDEDQEISLSSKTRYFYNNIEVSYNDLYDTLKSTRTQLSYKFDSENEIIYINGIQRDVSKLCGKGSKLSKAVIAYDDNWNIVKEYASVGEACRELNIISSSNINYACKNNSKSFGYYWKYKEEDR